RAVPRRQGHRPRRHPHDAAGGRGPPHLRRRHAPDGAGGRDRDDPPLRRAAEAGRGLRRLRPRRRPRRHHLGRDEAQGGDGEAAARPLRALSALTPAPARRHPMTWSRANFSFSFFCPTSLKNTVAVARSPSPSTAITLPLPKVAWRTRTPGTTSAPPAMGA